MLWQLCCWSNYIHSGKHEMLFCVFNNLFHPNQNFTLTSEKIIVSSRQKVCWNLSASFIAQPQYSAISLWNTKKSLTYSLFYKDYKDWTQSISCIYLLVTNSSSSFQKYQDNINRVIGFSQNSYNCFKKLVYKDYKNFDRLTFKRELEEKLNEQINENKHFEQMFL